MLLDAAPGSGDRGPLNDFRNALARHFGLEQPVTTVDGAHAAGFVREPVPPRPVDTPPGTIFRGKASRVVLTGVDARGREHRFGPEAVEVIPMRRDGKVIGLTFDAADFRTDLEWARRDPAEQQVTYQLLSGRSAEDVFHGPDARRVPSPWPDGPFFVSTHGLPKLFQVNLVGRPDIRMSGTEFARLLGSLDRFRSALGPTDRRAIVLLVCSAGTLVGEGGAAHDFQRTLAAEFGHRQPVVAPSAKMYQDTVGGFTLLSPGDEWRTFTSERSDLLGVGADGRTYYFHPGEVRAARLVDGGRIVGVSFGRSPGREPAIVDGAARAGTFHVETALSGGEFRVSLPGGRAVHLDGATFARVVAVSAPWRVAGRGAGSVVLHVSEPRRLDTRQDEGPTAALEGLRQALAAEFGHHGAVTIAGDAWQGAARPQTLAFQGTMRSGHVREFEVSDVVVGPLVKQGKTVGLTFRGKRYEQVLDQQWARGRGKSETVELPPEESRYFEARHRGLAHPIRAPWTGNALYVVAHGRPHSVLVSLNDGSDVPVDGATFARIVAGTQLFQDALADRRPDSIVLLSCSSAAVDGPGGAAYEFQRTLADEFGHPLPVTAPTTDVELAPDQPASELVERVIGYPSRTAVARGGRWLVFSTPPASLLGTDWLGRYRRFDAADVQRTEIVDGDRMVGVSFAAGAARLPEDSPAGVFHVDIRAGSRGFEVSLADGSHRGVDGRALARLVAESQPFLDAVGDGAARAVVLLTPGAGNGPALDFRSVLARHFGHDVAVVAPEGPVPQRLGPDFDVLTPDTGWQVFHAADGPEPVNDSPETVSSRSPRPALSLRQFLNGGGA